MHLYKAPAEDYNKNAIIEDTKTTEETISCDICSTKVENSEFAIYKHKDENHGASRPIKCAKCGVEQEHKYKSNIATENKMITLNEQIDQIELDSQLGIITPEIAGFELDSLMESNFSKQSNISNEVPITENEVLEKVKEAPVQKIETKSSECC